VEATITMVGVLFFFLFQSGTILGQGKNKKSSDYGLDGDSVNGVMGICVWIMDGWLHYDTVWPFSSVDMALNGVGYATGW
jgi:hypothetical protein